MSAEDELRRLLDERGIEWSASSDEIEHVTVTRWQAGGNSIAYVELNNGFIGYETRLIISGLFITPEQAIAATLGASNESARTLIDDMLDFIGNCCNTTLDCACCDPVDCKYLDGDGELAECTRYQDFLSRAKAIAVTIGGGECEVVQGKNGLECSKCGKELPYDPYADYEGNFCATCGARLRYGRR